MSIVFKTSRRGDVGDAITRVKQIYFLDEATLMFEGIQALHTLSHKKPCKIVKKTVT